ncbi:helix-turn-helix transcriptional regulator [Youngiibacter multivorans]|jgi:putative transcriptional regulator|uniref:Transcriptional regulator n=1 Tax=Youngiibacter multivorans TaxID=937251 RepID=A0ABS4G4H8_9CLOT|nr:helix-turn-helix transcriptional regulator [Youngiibacter multivorans]MBP1919450.1 putative transcriptional regulator [Youngiibacter multivorans]
MGVENRVREIRKNAGITQKKMAEDLKITRQTITAIEHNKYNPSLELALKITSYFGLPIEELFILKEELLGKPSGGQIDNSKTLDSHT